MYFEIAGTYTEQQQLEQIWRGQERYNRVNTILKGNEIFKSCGSVQTVTLRRIGTELVVCCCWWSMVLVSEQDKGVEEAEENTRESECRGIYCCCMKKSLVTED